MRGSRGMRACARLGIAIAALGGVTGTPAAAQSVPAVAVRGDKAYVAWAADGILQTATMKPNGTFAPGVGIGTAVDTSSPQLAITTVGDQLLLWRSQGVLRSAFRAVGPRQPWRFQTVATQLDRDFLTLLATDPGGRAIAVWSDKRSAKNGNYSLVSSTRPVGGEWSPPASLADDVNDVSMASDSAGDVVVTFLSRAAGASTGALAARLLPVGAAEWTPVTRISGADAVDLHSARVTGGGAGTFVAGWQVKPTTAGAGTLLRSARLHLPGGWSAPQSVLPEAPAAPISSANLFSGWSEAVDGLGTAVALVQFPKIAQGAGIAVTHLPAADTAWTSPVLLGQPAPYFTGDASGSLVLADDSSATYAFIRYALDGATLRLATTRGPLDAWQGQDIQIAEIHHCGYTSVCGRAWGATPVMAIGSHVTAIALQSTGGTVFAFTRTAPDGAWTGPIDLASAGTTAGRLLGTHVSKGAVRAVGELFTATVQGGCRAARGWAPRRRLPVLDALGRQRVARDCAQRLGTRPARTRPPPRRAFHVHDQHGRRWALPVGQGRPPLPLTTRRECACRRLRRAADRVVDAHRSRVRLRLIASGPATSMRSGWSPRACARSSPRRRRGRRRRTAARRQARPARAARPHPRARRGRAGRG